MNHITLALFNLWAARQRNWTDTLRAEAWSAFQAGYEAAQAAPTAGLPFVPWSKEAEMRESWAQAATTKEQT